jgi:hypothetical protein
LTINQICNNFARKSQDYKLTYSYSVALADEEDASAAKVHIEHLTKLFEQHCSALDTHHKFISDAYTKLKCHRCCCDLASAFLSCLQENADLAYLVHVAIYLALYL